MDINRVTVLLSDPNVGDHIQRADPTPVCTSSGISLTGRGLPVAMTSINSFSLEDKSPFTDILLVVSPSGQ